jgi:cytochrome c biogenesis protein CcmG/thiol:disulfide interchange protein DsbE
MGKQEQMTPSTAGGGADELAAGPASGRPDRGLRAWFATRSRAGRLVITSTAALTAVIVALLALSATSGGAPKAAAAQPPRPAPAFSLPVLGNPGQHLSLASYSGRPLIVNFFASWCAPCQRETPLIAKFYRAAHGRVTILGMDSADSAAKAEAFIRKAGVQYPVVSAPISTALSYNAPVLPVTFFLNGRHQIVRTIYGAVTQAELASGVATVTAASGRG